MVLCSAYSSCEYYHCVNVTTQPLHIVLPHTSVFFRQRSKLYIFFCIYHTIVWLQSWWNQIWPSNDDRSEHHLLQVLCQHWNILNYCQQIYVLLIFLSKYFEHKPCLQQNLASFRLWHKYIKFKHLLIYCFFFNAIISYIVDYLM